MSTKNNQSPDPCENEKSKHGGQGANRDVITGEPGSHPVGTGVGAVAGGMAAGAAAGTIVAGPIGAGVGAAAGALVGGLAGSAAAEKFNPTKGGDLERFIDYTVVDQASKKVGSIDAVWEDHTGQPTYLAVRTGWLGMGKAHVIPADLAEVNDEKKRIRLPFSAEKIKNAPSFDSQHDITNESEFTISSYFGFGEVGNPAPTPSSRNENSETSNTTIKLKSEEIKVGKREVEYAGVRLRKIVRTEIVNQPVELSREEIVIERVPLSGEVTTADADDFAGEEIYIPLRRDEAVVEKSVRMTEEVRVGKRREAEQENVQEELRREELEIDREADKR